MRLWRHYRRYTPKEISIGDARKVFCFLWKVGHAGAEERAHKALPSFAARSLRRWDKALKKGGLNALVDQRGQAQAGRGILDTDTQMRDLVLGMLADYPHAGATLLAQGLAVRFPSCRHRLPSVRTIQHWTKKWREENKVLWAHLCNPDAAKGRYSASVGRGDEGVDSLNALWEIDAGMADVLLSDGQRHTILGIIDVWSRRVLLHVTRTSPSSTVCTALRRAILAWGVPNVVRCDNGKEFISNHCPTGRGTSYSASSTSGVAACCCMSHAHHPRPPSAPRCVARSSRGEYPTSCDATTARSSSPTTHAPLSRTSGSRRKPLRPSSRSANPSSSVRWAHFSRPACAFAGLLRPRCERQAGDPLPPQLFRPFRTRRERGGQTEPRGFSGVLRQVVCALRKPPTSGARRSDPRLPCFQLDRAGAYDRGRARAGYPAFGTCAVRRPHGAQKGISVGGLCHVAADLGAYIGRRVRIRLDEGDAGKIFVFSKNGVFLCEAVCPERAGISHQQHRTSHTQGAGRDAARGQEGSQGCVPRHRPARHRSEDTGGREPEASAETPRRSTPALTPALKEAARAAHSDEVPETSPPSKEQGEVVDALALMRKRLQAKEQRVIQKQKELEAYMKKDAARVRNIKKARKELLEQERRESERLLAEERAKDAEPWPPPYLDAIVV